MKIFKHQTKIGLTSLELHNDFVNNPAHSIQEQTVLFKQRDEIGKKLVGNNRRAERTKK